MTVGRRRTLAGLASFFLYLGIFAASSIPAAKLPQKIPDIIPHFCVYALMAFFLVHAFRDPGSCKTLAIAFLGLALLGFFDELHQSFVPGRHGSLKDLLFDLAGSAAGLLFSYWLASRTAKLRQGN